MFLTRNAKSKVQFKQLIEDTSSNAATENFGQLEQQLDEVLDDNAKIWFMSSGMVMHLKTSFNAVQRLKHFGPI